MHLHKLFVVMNDKTMESTKSKWPGHQHAMMLEETGFCYTGQDKIVECLECKVSVNMKDNGVITLNEHNSNCEIVQRLRDVKSLNNVQSNQKGSNERKENSTLCPEVKGLLESPTQNPQSKNSPSLRQLRVDDTGKDTLVEHRSFGQKNVSKDEVIIGQNSSFLEQRASTEGRGASGLGSSVGQSDIPTLENSFELQNTTQCAKYIQHSFVENNESRQHNPLPLENGALEQGHQFKQDGPVVQQSTINAEEISRPIANTFGANHISTSVLESLLENQNPSIEQYVRKDIKHYTTYESIKRAPSSRYYPSSRRRCSESGFMRFRGHDMYGRPIIPEKTLVLKMKQRVESGPLHPEFNLGKDRRKSFQDNGIIGDNTVLQAEAGFYYAGKLKSFEFYWLYYICI